MVDDQREDEDIEHLEQEDTVEPEGPEEKKSQPVLSEEGIPPGIVRLRDEWARLGLHAAEPTEHRIGLEPVIFPEPVGDYVIPAEEARHLLGLSDEAMDRLLGGGELDSIMVRFDDGTRRMVSEAALARFLQDTGMDPALSERITPASPEIAAEFGNIHREVEAIREQQARQLQQFKDILLLELRNLKEQDRDLTSFIYDLTAALEELNPKLKKRRRTPPPG